MSKDLSAKYYQDNKERRQIKSCERYQSLYKKEKENMQQYGFENTKIYQKMNSKSLFNIKKIL